MDYSALPFPPLPLSLSPPLPLWAMELLASLFLYAWLFCVGASVGSFLNVVVYRLPRRKNLAYPGSQCPRCGRSIRLKDNIPIVSWLALGGRCRDCNSPIPPRYFLVELAVATLFLAVALIETKLTGTFPRRNWDASRWLISPYETLPFWSAYALHVILLTTLLGAALIDSDGFRTPRRLFVPVMFLAIALHASWLDTQDLSLLLPKLDSQWQTGLVFSLHGLLLGAILGVIVAAPWRLWTGHIPRFAPIMLLAAVGAVAGWRGGMEIAVLGTVLFAITLAGLRLARSSAIVPFAAIALLAALPRIVDLDLRLSLPLVWPVALQGVIIASCLLSVMLAALAASLLAPPQYFAAPPADLPPVEAVSREDTPTTTDEASPLPIVDEESPPHDPST
jgi:prepilin signal peptidase PulO-like enzyme (type II secretory pathway)